MDACNTNFETGPSAYIRAKILVKLCRTAGDSATIFYWNIHQHIARSFAANKASSKSGAFNRPPARVGWRQEGGWGGGEWMGHVCFTVDAALDALDVEGVRALPPHHRRIVPRHLPHDHTIGTSTSTGDTALYCIGTRGSGTATGSSSASPAALCRGALSIPEEFDVGWCFTLARPLRCACRNHVSYSMASNASCLSGGLTARVSRTERVLKKQDAVDARRKCSCRMLPTME